MCSSDLLQGAGQSLAAVLAAVHPAITAFGAGIDPVGQVFADRPAAVEVQRPLAAVADVIPDIIVRRTAHGWRAEPNPSARLSLRVHDEYEALLKNHRKAAPSPAQTGRSGAEWEQQVTEDSHAESPSAPEHNLLHQLQEARTLARNVQQRGDTIVLVAQAIVDRQKVFFNHGPEALRPLVLRDIAEVVGRHESTISRATSQKYIRTPFGIFELKYFFGSQVATDSGGAASSTAVCALIQKFIEQEDTNQPLSDSQLTEQPRSEERRVGKECRSRWSPYH